MKIALLGSAPSSRMLAPFNDPEWEIWSCSPGNMDLPRSDAFFEIHGPDTVLREQQYVDMGYIKYCQSHPRIYMQEVRPEFPGAVEYPMEEMSRRFGDYFWTSSLAYMQALAQHEIEKKGDPENVIGLWGVDMQATDEWAHQRPGCHYFIQEAKRAGIQVYVPMESDILEPPPPYGYRESSRMWWKVNTRWKELHGKHQQTSNEIAQLNAKLAQLKRHQITLEGAMEDAQYICNTFYKEK